jgi:radical SAM-linked protein
LSLALGIAGCNEVVDLELTEPLTAEDVQRRLSAQAPPGITISSTRRLPGKSSCQVRRAFYRLTLPDDARTRHGSLPERVSALLSAKQLWVRRARPRPRKLDIRPYLDQLACADGQLTMVLWVTPIGSARPDEIAHLLALDDVLADGAYFERTDLELVDEAGVPALVLAPSTAVSDPAPAPPVAPGFLEQENKAQAPTPLMAGPLSFDS